VKFHHKTTELGQSKDLDALVVAAVRDANRMNEALPMNVMLGSYEQYVQMCERLSIEPLTREQVRTVPNLGFCVQP